MAKASAVGVDLIRIVRANPLSAVAFISITAIVAVALFGPYVVTHDPYTTNGAQASLPPSAEHLFGTDRLGRDMLSRVVYAARLDLFIAVAAVAASAILGSIIGGVCGLIGGLTDRIVGRFVDVVMAFPLFVLAVALVAALGNEVENVILATAIVNLPFYIRLARSEVRTRRSLLYVDAAYLSGRSAASILRGVLLPNALPLLSVQISLNMGWAISNAAGLSFLGLGIVPPTAEWGIMVAEGANDILAGSWWTALFPGIALMYTILSFNLAGDAMRDLLDPRTRA